MGLQRDSSKHLSHLINPFSFWSLIKPPGLYRGGWGRIFETPLPLTCYELGIVGTPHRQFPTSDSTLKPPFFPCVLCDLGLGR